MDHGLVEMGEPELELGFGSLQPPLEASSVSKLELDLVFIFGTGFRPSQRGHD